MIEKKILIVDYDAVSLEILTSILEPCKFQIIRATDGQAAYEKFKEEKPDVVILEAILPKIHGFDLTKRITEESRGRVPVIIVTGLYRGPQYRLEALSTFGATDYFEKPVDRERLVRTVLSLISEDEEIEEDLPHPDQVLRALTQRYKARGAVPEK
jgi:DNA-binding response OmpR family regulator